MKTFTFIATIVFSLLLISCTADSEEILNPEPTQVQIQKFDTNDSFAREIDTITEGEPVIPIKRD